jgi:hypothetical protein
MADDDFLKEIDGLWELTDSGGLVWSGILFPRMQYLTKPPEGLK